MLKLLGWSVTVDSVETSRRIHDIESTLQNSRKSKKYVLPIYYIFCLNILNTPKPFPILRMSLLQGVFLTKTTETVIDHQKHRLRTPNEAFFHWNPELLGLGRQIGQINSGSFGVFSAKLSAPMLAQWVLCPCFPLFNHYLYFYKKLSLYIHIPNIYLGFEFEFFPQGIRDLTSMYP